MPSAVENLCSALAARTDAHDLEFRSTLDAIKAQAAAEAALTAKSAAPKPKTTPSKTPKAKAST